MISRAQDVAARSAQGEILERRIRSLNESFDLNLHFPDPTSSPSSRREENVPPDQRRARQIFSRMHKLQYTDSRRLSACLGRFQTEARRILREIDSRKNRAGRSFDSDATRGILQDMLQELLFAEADDDTVRRNVPKRRFDDNSATAAKRSRSRSSGNVARAANEIDAIPIHSRSQLSRVDSRLDARDANAEPIKRSHPIDWGSPSLSCEDSQESNNSSVFSKPADQPQITQSTFTSSDDSNRSRREPGSSLRQGASGFEDNHSPGSDRLQNIWPKLPRSLDLAPLAVMWDLTRIAQHCGVDLSSANLPYHANKWRSMDKMREDLRTQDAFRSQEFPPKCSTEVWETALDGFQSADLTVVLSATFIWQGESAAPLFRLRMNPLKFERGHRLARRFGADRFLEVLIPSQAFKATTDAKGLQPKVQDIVEWLVRGNHYFLGRKWIPFYTKKDEKTSAAALSDFWGKATKDYFERVYFFASNGNHFEKSSCLGSFYEFPPASEAKRLEKRTKMRLSDLLRWAVNISSSENQKSSAAKLFQRLALSLSRTRPTEVLDQDALRHKKDIRDGRSRAGKVMNDGVGRMSLSLAEKIRKLLAVSTTIPKGFQGRIGSAKGMWIVDTDDDGSTGDWIELYESQEKWHCDFTDEHHRTFEVREISRPLKPAALNKQFIPLLESRASNKDQMRCVIAEHLKESLKEDLDEIRAAMNDPSQLRLLMSRLESSMSYREAHECVEFLGGLPAQATDIVQYLLVHGFDPKIYFLREKIYEMGKKRGELLKTKFNIRVPCSTNAYMVADFTGSLAEDEVHLSFSSNFSVEGFSDTNLEGMEVLVARAPAHFPSDIQKVKVVSKSRLRQLKDMIVFSTRGRTALADKLSGGDYDGDKAWICWDPKIVALFQNAEVPEQDDFFARGFLEKWDTKFVNYVNRVSGLEAACYEFMAEALAFNVREDLLGQCTSLKDQLCYNLKSLEEKKAIDMSTLLSNLVDWAKGGTIFSSEHKSRFMKDVIKPPRSMIDPLYKGDRATLRETRGRPHHILDYLKFIVAENFVGERLNDFETTIKSQYPNDVNFDPDMTKFHNDFEAMGKECGIRKAILLELRREIEDLRGDWGRKTSSKKPDSDFQTTVKQIHSRWLAIQPPPVYASSMVVRDLLESSWKDPRYSKWSLLKASVTYSQYNGQGKFLWWVAGTQLAIMKAMQCGVSLDSPAVWMTPKMYAASKPSRSLISRWSTKQALENDTDSIAAFEAIADFEDVGWQMDDT